MAFVIIAGNPALGLKLITFGQFPSGYFFVWLMGKYYYAVIIQMSFHGLQWTASDRMSDLCLLASAV